MGSTANPQVSTGLVSGIPIRNIWLLMLYASNLFRQLDQNTLSDLEENPDEIADLVAEVLTHAVEKRLKRNLSSGYRPQHATLNRVRGRIAVLETTTKQLLLRGAVACDFQQLTIDTPRNQYVRAALEAISILTNREELAHRCRSQARLLDRLGVTKRVPERAEINAMRLSRNDRDDRFMIVAAKLAFELALPTQLAGNNPLLDPAQCEIWMRSLFEKAVAGFYDIVLPSFGWKVNAGRVLHWPATDQTTGMVDILPSMQLDIVVEQAEEARRIVIDTKFTSILKKGRFGQSGLRSGYLYQIYAYLRSQESGADPLSETAEGVLLHPSVGTSVDESAVIQGHRIRAATVDLAAPTSTIRLQLLRIVDSGG